MFDRVRIPGVFEHTEADSCVLCAASAGWTGILVDGGLVATPPPYDRLMEPAPETAQR